jgi:hypothetical protein
MVSVRGNGATRLDITELGSQRHYILSAWPFIWLLQTIAMTSQLKIVQEQIGIFGVITSIATSPVYLASINLPIPTIMVESPYYNDGIGEKDFLQRDIFIGKKTPSQNDDDNDDDKGSLVNYTAATATNINGTNTKIEPSNALLALNPNDYFTLYPVGRFGLINVEDAADGYIAGYNLFGGEKGIEYRTKELNGPPIQFENKDSPKKKNLTMITGKERSYDEAGSVTSLWRIIFVTIIVWSIVLIGRYLLVRYIRIKMERLALQYRLCPVFDPRIIVGPGGVVTTKPMSKMQHEEMKQRLELFNKPNLIKEKGGEEDKIVGLGIIENGKMDQHDEEDEQKMSVLTMTAPEGLELIAKRTKGNDKVKYDIKMFYIIKLFLLSPPLHFFF